MSDEEDQRRICHNCVGEAFLSAHIEQNGGGGQCHYCSDDEEPSITLTELADEIEGAFNRHFIRTSPDPSAFESAMMRDKEIDYDWDQEGEPVLWAIADAANVSEPIAQDVLDILEERHGAVGSDYCGEEEEFSSESHYEEKGADDFEFRMEFDLIETSVKQQTRFFNREAEAFFQRLFADLDGYADRQGAPVVVAAGPDQALKSFYRARAFQDEEELVLALARPYFELGPPPTWVAKAGRMNAQGISVFYGATVAEAALAEIRPPVGSKVLVGRFDLVRAVRLLDIDALQSVFVAGSYFDPDYLSRLELAAFLSRLSERMTMPVMPVMPNDEPKEYLITQMIADFVAQLGDPPIDGMLYRSVQADGDPKNVVLFNHAASVTEWDIPDETEIDPRTFEMDDDGGSVNYTVFERVPPPAEQEEPGGPTDPFEDWDSSPIPSPSGRPFDARERTLSLDPATLQVHHVTGVTIATESYDVTRHRFEDHPRTGLIMRSIREAMAAGSIVAVPSPLTVNSPIISPGASTMRHSSGSARSRT